MSQHALRQPPHQRYFHPSSSKSSPSAVSLHTQPAVTTTTTIVTASASAAAAAPATETTTAVIPSYLSSVYTWAYLTPSYTSFLDHQRTVNTILFGNAQRLINAALDEIPTNQIDDSNDDIDNDNNDKDSDTVTWWQPAAVYGTFSAQVSDRLSRNYNHSHDGNKNHCSRCHNHSHSHSHSHRHSHSHSQHGRTTHTRLVVSDVADLQVDLTRTKLHRACAQNTQVLRQDARDINPCGPFDGVLCFFLLHEVPADVRTDIMHSLLKQTKPGGKVVFVDYAKPYLYNPVRPLISLILHQLEPFAKDLWHRPLRSFVHDEQLARQFQWTREERFFGGMYQKVVATRSIPQPQ